MAETRRAAAAKASRAQAVQRYAAASTPGDRALVSLDYLRAAASPPHPHQAHVDTLLADVDRLAWRFAEEAAQLRVGTAMTEEAGK